MVTLTNLIAYYTYHSKSQLYLLADVISYATNDFVGVLDGDLICNNQYQEIVRRREKFIIKRHIELLRLLGIANKLTVQLLLWMSLAFIGMLLSVLSSAFFVEADYSFWYYFRHVVLVLTALLTGVLLIQCGQEIESESQAILSNFLNIRWTSFNRSNRKTALIALTVAQNPIKLQFTQKVSINYAFGLRIVRTLFSFAAIFSKVKNYDI
ncbi:hypothetical protein Zmor_015025 [Zophobas morio]|uniref:Uncharacterized protein n=1 Tax=Zophobas morio TaxID=2755281 RepID=A0AA38IDJ0_9CUCU|nr:hypothetical protein Zmor_015025 [Zophobas morio]